jgi:tetratricopeptide (TPR) repeat protein
LFALVLLVAAPAIAQDAPNVVEARERITRGEALFERGDFDAALAEFEAAYEAIGEHPSRFLVLYNIGQCHERRFRYDVALTFYQRYLDEGGSAVEGHEAVEASVIALGDLLSRVTIHTSAPGAEAFVDGRSVGEVPGEVLVPAGFHAVSVRASGYVPAERSLEIPAAGHMDITLEPTRLSDEYRGVSPYFAIAFGGAAIAALGVGIGLGVAALDQRAGIDAQLADPVARWSVTESSFDGIRTLALTADILYASAAVFGLTAVVLAVMGDWSFGALRESDASIALTIGPSSIGLRGAF